MNKITITTIAFSLFSTAAFCQNNTPGNIDAAIRRIQSLKEYKSEVQKAEQRTKKEGINTKVTLLLDTNTVSLIGPQLHIAGTTPPRRMKAYINEVQGENSVPAYEILLDSKTKKILSVKKAAAM